MSGHASAILATKRQAERELDTDLPDDEARDLTAEAIREAAADIDELRADGHPDADCRLADIAAQLRDLAADLDASESEAELLERQAGRARPDGGQR
jgi:hypothetical protein